MIGLVAVTAAGRVGADTVAASLRQQGDEVTTYETSAADALRQAFGECDAVVCFLAVGAAVRLVAPLLRDKASDPGLVCVDEGTRHAVAVLGGHSGGANALAERVASVLGAEPVITTATDAVSLPGLDTLGWPVEGDVAGVGRALLDGDDVRLAADASWPLPALGLRADQVGDHPTSPHVLWVTDREVRPAPGHVVLRPPSLVLGVGASRGAPTDQVRTLVLDTLRDNGLSPASVCEVVSIDLKADEVAIIALATTLGVPYRTFTAHDLDAHAVPTPSEVVAAATGSRSVAEASVLQAGADLIAKGCEVIFQAAGSDGSGAIQAIKEARAAGKSVYAIGVDSDQSHLAPEAMLTSMIKRVDLAVWQAASDLKDGKYTAGDQVMGLKEGGVSYAPVRLELPGKEELLSKVEALRTKIVAGEIKVPSNPTDLAAFK